MSQARLRFGLRWIMVAVAAAAILAVGIVRGAIWAGVLLVWGDATLFPVPAPVQVLRFWVFVGWWAALLAVVVGLVASDRLRASPDQKSRRNGRIVRGLMTLFSLAVVVETIAYAGLESRSDRYYRLAARYEELAARDSPKAGPGGDPAKFQLYSDLRRKYLDAGGTPWRPVAPDPPGPD